MTDQPYNRTVIYPLEKPLADDLNQEFSQADRSLRDTFFALLRGREGFLSTGFLVLESSPAALSVLLKAGLGWQDAPSDVPTGINSVLGLNDLSRYKPIILSNDLTIAVPAPPGANGRIDLLEVRYNRQVDNPQSRNFLDPNTNAFSPSTVPKTLDFNVDGTLAYYAAAAVPTTALAYKSGVVSGSPVPPAVDSGYLPLAYIAVNAGDTQILDADITVLRSVIGGGEYLGRQIFTANGTYSPTVGTTRVQIHVVAGGGGSGGIDGVNLENTVSRAGASGVHVAKFIDGLGQPIVGGPVVVGAAGTAGGTGPATAGGTGGDSSIEINTVTWLAKGGTGGIAGVSTGATDVGFSGSPIQAGSSVGDYSTGQPSMGSFATDDSTTGRIICGTGGSNAFGAGGRGGPFPNGTAGTGYGSGGGATGISSVGNVAGFAGAPGIVIVDEWT